MGHLKTPVLVGLAVLFFLGLVRWGIPVFFAEVGPDRLRTVLGVGGTSNVPEDVEEWASKPVQHVGVQNCSQCHGEQVTQWNEGSHAAVSCEGCHGPGRDHVARGVSLGVNTSSAFCARCHSKALGRPPSFPQVALEEHAGGLLCTSCHNPHSPELGPPQVPHSVESRPNCLACHGPERWRPVPDSHAGREESECLQCHRTK